MNILWITNRPIAAGEKKFNVQATSGTWMEPTLIELQKKKDVSLSVVTVAKVNQIEKMEEEGIQYYFLPIRGKKIYQYDSPISKSEWKHVISDSEPDIIMLWGTEYAHGLCGLRIANEMKIPVCVMIQGIIETVAKYYLGGMTHKEIKSAYTIRNFIKQDSLYQEQEFYYQKAKVEREMLRCAGNIIIENSWAECHCREIAPQSMFYCCHQNISQCFFEKNWEIKKFERHSVFCSAPSGYPLKGLHQIIRAIAIVKKRYPDIKLYIPGLKDLFAKKNIFEKVKTHGYMKYVKNLIVQLDVVDNIRFMGRLNSEQMAERMEKSHVMVIPSAIENCSTTLREAMAVGTPCVASYVGGIPETIEHGRNGYLYRFEECEMLADYIMKLFEDDNLACDFSKTGKSEMAPYLDVKKSTDALMDIYKAISKQ